MNAESPAATMSIKAPPPTPAASALDPPDAHREGAGSPNDFVSKDFVSKDFVSNEDVGAPTWTEHLLSGGSAPTWSRETKRMITGLGLATLFGAALGLRTGGPAILFHAVGVPSGMIAVAVLAAPAFAIVLALANAPVHELSLARAVSRATASAGLVLGGLAPAAALFMVTVEDAITVTIMGSGFLLLAGALAMRSFATELAPQLATGGARTRRLTALAMPMFLAFSAILAARVWWMMLPALRGGLS